MEKILKLLEEYDQKVLRSHFKDGHIDNIDHINLNDLKEFLEKLNKLKYKDDKIKNYKISAPNIINLNNSIYEHQNLQNGTIIKNIYKNDKINNELKQIGLKCIKENKVAVIFLAGGLGSRLHLKKAKGLLPITPILNKSFFQFYFEQIRFLQDYCFLFFENEIKPYNNNFHNNTNCYDKNISNDYKKCGDNNRTNNCLSQKENDSNNINDRKNVNYKYLENTNESVNIYIYIMTSDFTYDHTIKYLQDNNFFGINSNNVKIFKQCNNFITNFNFDILMKNHNTVLTAPGGNGTIFKALYNNMIINDMINKNVKYIQIVSIDNILNKIADPVLIGLCSFYNCDIVNKAIIKKENEAVGIFCMKEKKNQMYDANKNINKCEDNDKDNPFCVCEYTELSEDILKNSELFKYGNICHHIFSLDFLQHIVKNKIYNNMELHKISREKEYYNFTSSVSNNNTLIKSKVYCYEYFIFDIFKYAKKILAYEVCCDNEFNPIKTNNNGDSILSAKISLSNLHKSWLIKKNFNIIQSTQENNNFCEISPLTSYDGSFFFNFPKQRDIQLPFVLDRDTLQEN
ncbi:UDP-N-acetylglucosamine pyrophosphorylase, putative [Plasmodium berghei]|uniref:UDP-N-acetylglucosamine diphosphorylase n=2 Tax=Plasmodium berghei TaxID=5821 RepID=A0A509APD7_PLABA|nr:UDP-N-acetylglucosamine pyrophosphorylase, putative [Plasmodium berghei ANKA]CXJ03476.1 UDP-N-acetylglucosamine pyrophosphorylase, putative [Plasmodium berghei]SCL98484.1 UDP-N-acetylglucosamine pyrophosphorylase, putative [Plasmodium berghei]SCM16839.1 UDP-N-acetylglucosamine pyrophosphorylase, putative [Plasmodium berghei]SCM18637.1 UDP-N-acetylglucosamine pyrophosphorylase, putative [Plasmodium berghei]SCN28072.1 UDP-N-acetylglucosamine pyrophosphorylase, putative [Plasmodium berghei]|eukprot:XP_034423723.1 UDP-N-acetylglucosamine pyrophosphorylase, putative [Plasmodium berghei ANKA]